MKQDLGKYPKFARGNSFLLTTLYNDNSTSGLEALELVSECGLFVKIKYKVTGIGKNILLTMGNISWPLLFPVPFPFLSQYVLTNLTSILRLPLIPSCSCLGAFVQVVPLPRTLFPLDLHSTGSFLSSGLSSDSLPRALHP